MTYQEQLEHDLWKEKRKSIIQRDGCKCQVCNNESFKKNYNYGIIFSNDINHMDSI